jgi:N-sulfoglucosamine sulfohydrolase
LPRDKAITPFRASYFGTANRLGEWLYELKCAPHQTLNLANNSEYGSVLNEHRQHLKQWKMKPMTRGVIPKPGIIKAGVQVVEGNMRFVKV